MHSRSIACNVGAACRSFGNLKNYLKKTVNMNTKDEGLTVSPNDGKPLVSRRSFMWWSTDDLIDCLPQNRPLYKDSGLWQIRTDDMEDVFIQQNTNETLRGFIIRYLEFLDEFRQADEVYIDLSGRPMNGG